MAMTGGWQASTRPAWWALSVSGAVAVSVGIVQDASYSSAMIAATSTASIVAIFLGIRLHRPVVARFWWLVAAALIAGILAGALGMVYRNTLLWAIAIDTTYIMGYALFVAAGLLLLPRGRGRHDWSSTLDATTIGLAGALVFWYFAVSPRLAQPLSFHLVTTGIVFPVFDLLLLVVASRLATSSVRHSFAFGMVVAALCASIVSDFWYAVTTTDDIYVWGSASDLLWVVPTSALGVAALHPSMATIGTGPARPHSEITWRRVFLVGVGSVAAPLVVAGTALRAGRLDEQWPALLVGSALLSLAGVARAAEMVRELRIRAEELQSLAGRLQASLTRSEQLQTELQETARRDPLTGLANRRLLHERLEQLLAGGGRCTVMFLDIDDFKNINDGLGHAVGDLVLVAVGRRLREHLRSVDTVVRLGGDEFAILLPDADREVVASIGDRLVKAIAEPIEASGHRVHTHVSIGVATAEPGANAGDLSRDADIAMYAAKRAGKNQVIWFRDDMGRSVVERVRLEDDLRHAMGRGEITLAYQPVVGLADGRVGGVEALARWVHPVRGSIPPSEFIPLAEDCGLILPLGRLMLITAVAQVRRWNAQGFALNVAVNVSAQQLSDPLFVEEARAAALAMGPDQCLVLELTESALFGEAEHLELLTSLRTLGCRIAIDDFGTGFSSLGYLRSLPIDIVKIDRSFLKDMHRDPEAASLVQAILGLGKTFGYTVIAEGIEHEATATALRRYGCEFGQGFLYWPPLPPDELEAALATPLSA